VRHRFDVSERRACFVFGQHRTTQRRIPDGRKDADRLVFDKIERLACTVDTDIAGLPLYFVS